MSWDDNKVHIFTINSCYGSRRFFKTRVFLTDHLFKTLKIRGDPLKWHKSSQKGHPRNFLMNLLKIISKIHKELRPLSRASLKTNFKNGSKGYKSTQYNLMTSLKLDMLQFFKNILPTKYKQIDFRFPIIFISSCVQLYTTELIIGCLC